MGNALCASADARSRSSALAAKNFGSSGAPVAGFVAVKGAASAPSPKPIRDTGFSSNASSMGCSLFPQRLKPDLFATTYVRAKAHTPRGLKHTPRGLKRTLQGLKRTLQGLKRTLQGLKRTPGGLKGTLQNQRSS